MQSKVNHQINKTGIMTNLLYDYGFLFGADQNACFMNFRKFFSKKFIPDCGTLSKSLTASYWYLSIIS